MGRLNDKAVAASKAGAKQLKISDGDGLALIVKPNGTKLWWFRFRFGGKEKTLALGEYPLVSLKDARQHTQDARRLLIKGIDPMAEKRAQSNDSAIGRNRQGPEFTTCMGTLARRPRGSRLGFNATPAGKGWTRSTIRHAGRNASRCVHCVAVRLRADQRGALYKYTRSGGGAGGGAAGQLHPHQGHSKRCRA